MAIPNVVTARYRATWLSQTLLPPGNGPPGYSRRRFLKVLGPLAIRNVVSQTPPLSQTVSSRYWAPWLSQTSLLSGNGSPGFPRRRSLQVLSPLAIPEVVSSRNCLSQMLLPPGTGPPGYPRRRFLSQTSLPPRILGFLQVLGLLAIPDVLVIPPGTGSPGYPRRWLSQTPFPPGTGSHGYPRRRFLQLLGPLAIPDAVSYRYWAPCLSQTLLPQGTGPPGYPRRRFLQGLGPLAIPDVVSSRYWVPWLSETSLPPDTGPPGYPRRRYL